MDILVIVIDILGMIAAVILVVNDLLRAQSEDEGILRPHFLHDLHVGSVHSSQCGSAVQHEFHVSCSGCLLGGRGNLLADICRRKDDLRIGHAVVLDKDDLQLSVDAAVVVDHVPHGVDKLDDLLCPDVAGGCLRAEDKGPRIEGHLRMLLDLVVQIHHMEDVEELSLVLVETFYLHVKDGAGIYLDTVVL